MLEILLYSFTFCFFLGLVFYILRAMKIERLFEQGRVFEIRVAYIIFSIMGAYILTEFVFRLLGFANISL